MSLDALGGLEAAHEKLISALDSSDIEAIEERLEEMRRAVGAVRALGGWRESPQLQERARRIVQLSEAARIRVNFLTDMTRQHLQMLAAARGQVINCAYARPGG